MTKHTVRHKSRRFRRFLKANKAVSALEYALLVGVIATGVGAAILAFGENIATAVSNIGGQVEAIDVTGPTVTNVT